jgi:hypothetical protein
LASSTCGRCYHVNLSGAAGSAFINGFNNLDQFAGAVCDNLGCHAFIDTKGVFTKFDDPNAIPGTTFGDGLNDLDQVVGEYEDSSGNLPAFSTPMVISPQSMTPPPVTPARVSSSAPSLWR